MKGAVKVTLQIVFLIALVYVLASIFGAAQGLTVNGPNFRARVGKGKCRGWKGYVRTEANPWVSSGMYGEMIASPGLVAPMIGPQIAG